MRARNSVRIFWSVRIFVASNACVARHIGAKFRMTARAGVQSHIDLQEDKENMQKELQVWLSEGQHWGKQLAEELQQAKEQTDTQHIAQMDEEIANKHAQIKQLKRQIIQNEEKLMKMMSLTIGEE
jgi:hypothetical protein